jgi:hypothetical protein
MAALVNPPGGDISKRTIASHGGFSMLLVLGSENDCVAREVHRRLVTSIASVVRIDEPDLFAATPFSLTLDHTQRSGFLRFQERQIALSDITGILFRLPRVWWPSSEFDLQDQQFVYHESSSAWFSLLTGIKCPQFNRFGIGWWVHDLAYLEQLRLGAALALGVPAVDTRQSSPHPIRIFPTQAPTAEHSRHIYLIGDRVLPTSVRDASLADRVHYHVAELTRWQDATGIHFCRLDFSDNDTIELAYVEPMPILDNEPATTISEVAEELARRLS